MSGSLWQLWDFKIQYDFINLGKATTLNGLKDVFVIYKGYEPFTLKAGHIKEPFSLEAWDSTKYITFMERALPNVLSPARNIGIRAHTYGDMWTVALGLYGGSPSQPIQNGYGITGRATFSPVHEERRVLHFGIGSAWRSSNDDDTLRFRRRPESHITDIRLVDTGSFNAVNYYQIGLEMVAIHGPFAMQGEYIRVAVNGSNDVDFAGYYIEASWFLTGDSRRYNFKGGNFIHVKPDKPVGLSGIGAWQIAVRISNVDLTDGVIVGGDETNLSLGLNWYLTGKLRVIANYVKVLDVEGGRFAGVEPGIFQLRGQIYW